VTVAPVLVGDAAHDPRTAALVAAAREAMVNAAKHAGVEEISVYAEVEDAPGTIAVFVRDRGRGFDPATVPDDRHGLADSIRARVERQGGTVRVRTTPGEGTEVALTLPRAVPAPGPTTPERTTSEVA
jgi:signal transduction histidine kinase